jgi:putative transposon-encoded protein
MGNESHINLSTEDEEFLESINGLDEDKKNNIIGYLKNKLEANEQRVFSVEEITIKPSQLFTGKVVKSGNGASISFKKKFIGKKVYIIVKD